MKEELSEIEIAAEKRAPYPVEGLSKLAQQTVSEIVRFYHVPDIMCERRCKNPINSPVWGTG
jgi:hypothetical protein